MPAPVFAAAVGRQKAGAVLALLCSLWGLGHTDPAVARDWDLTTKDGSLHLEWLNTLSAGAAIREEKQNPNLIGKSFLPENRELCAPDDCIGLSSGATEPNARYLAARGALNNVTDDGDINYKRGDLVAAPFKWTSRFTADYGKSGVELSWLTFFDPVNEYLKEQHPNRQVTHGPQPGVYVTTGRDDLVKKDIGLNFELRNANIHMELPLPDDRYLDFRIGRQLLTWGTAAVNAQGGLNIVNPLDANALLRPGVELYELYRPQGMLTIKGELGNGWSFDSFYQYEWRPYGFPARGSFISFFNAGNEVQDHEAIQALFAKTPEDPLQIGQPALPLARLITDTSFSLTRAPNHEPPGDGQFGAALHYFDEDIAEGTEFGLYAANYHARIPNASATAAKASCARREGNARNNDATGAVDFLQDCGLGLQSLGLAQPLSILDPVANALVPIDTRPPGPDTYDALPLGTGHYFLDYPKNIHLLGGSFSSQLQGYVLEGELSYRPNQPVQVDLEDVLFAAFQPIFPRRDVVIIPEAAAGVPLGGAAGAVQSLLSLVPALNAALPDLAPATLAASTHAIPDYLTRYRGGTPGEVVPGSYIQGYERMPQWQGTLSMLRLHGPDNPFKAEQLGILLELTGIYLPDLPSLDRLQFEGPGTNTHHSPGVAETGDGLVINPIATKTGYVTKLSYGYRLGALASYNDVYYDGLSLSPTVFFTHDVHGVGPGLAENFLQGRRILVGNLKARYRDWNLSLVQAFIGGGGNNNTLNDRDFFSATVSYDF